MLQFSWSDPAVANSTNAFAQSLRSDYVTTSGYDSLSVYVSYAHGDETLAARYGEQKLERLGQLKRRWDPKNVFGFDNALPTS